MYFSLSTLYLAHLYSDYILWIGRLRPWGDCGRGAFAINLYFYQTYALQIFLLQFALRYVIVCYHRSINYGASDMSNNIIDTNLGKKVDLQRISEGSASPITKSGAFYVFSLRVAVDDVREYSFTNRDRAVSMRSVLVSHLAQKMQLATKKKVI